jgi:hypothetical protein
VYRDISYSIYTLRQQFIQVTGSGYCYQAPAKQVSPLKEPKLFRVILRSFSD